MKTLTVDFNKGRVCFNNFILPIGEKFEQLMSLLSTENIEIASIIEPKGENAGEIHALLKPAMKLDSFQFSATLVFSNTGKLYKVYFKLENGLSTENPNYDYDLTLRDKQRITKKILSKTIFVKINSQESRDLYFYDWGFVSSEANPLSLFAFFTINWSHPLLQKG